MRTEYKVHCFVFHGEVEMEEYHRNDYVIFFKCPKCGRKISVQTREFSTEKIDIEKDYDIPVFEKMDNCLKELINLTNGISEEELKRGWFAVHTKEVPPLTDSNFYDLIFKVRDKKLFG